MALDLHPTIGPDGLIRVTHEQHEEMLRIPIEAAEAEAALMLQHGMSPAAAFGRIRQGHADSARMRAETAARGAQQQQQVAAQPAVAQAAAPPVVQPATPAAPAAPPLAAPGSPPPHIPLVSTPNARLMANFYAARGMAAHRQTGGDNRFDLSLPMGLARSPR